MDRSAIAVAAAMEWPKTKHSLPDSRLKGACPRIKSNLDGAIVAPQNTGWTRSATVQLCVRICNNLYYFI